MVRIMEDLGGAEVLVVDAVAFGALLDVVVPEGPCSDYKECLKIIARSDFGGSNRFAELGGRIRSCNRLRGRPEEGEKACRRRILPLCSAQGFTVPYTTRSASP